MHDDTCHFLYCRRFNRTQIGIERTQSRPAGGVHHCYFFLCRWNFKEFTAHNATDFILVLASASSSNVECRRDMVFHFRNYQSTPTVAVPCGCRVFLRLHDSANADIANFLVLRDAVIS